MEVSQLKEKVESFLDELKGQEAVLLHSINEENTKIIGFNEFIEGATSRLELMAMAQSFLQKLVDLVSKKNIIRINELVNSALTTIFYDMDITFAIRQKIKRNMNTYMIIISKDGVEGNVNSFGGGVIAVVALVLKILFNLFSGSYPLIVLDESLSFLSDKYIKNASHFINELSKEFNIPIILVTHQNLFSEHAETRYVVRKNPNLTDSLVVKA